MPVTFHIYLWISAPRAVCPNHSFASRARETSNLSTVVLQVQEVFRSVGTKFTEKLGIHCHLSLPLLP